MDLLKELFKDLLREFQDCFEKELRKEVTESLLGFILISC